MQLSGNNISRQGASPTSPTSWLGTMKTLGFAFFISTTFCFREFAWAVSAQASPTVCVDVPLALQRTCCESQGHLWLAAPRLPIGFPTTPISHDAVHRPGLLCGVDHKSGSRIASIDRLATLIGTKRWSSSKSLSDVSFDSILSCPSYDRRLNQRARMVA